MAAAFGQDVECVATGVADVGVQAVCFEAGVSVGLVANSPEIREEAGAWR
jgi:hypothetical protein